MVDGEEVRSTVDSASHRSAPVDATDLRTVYDAARTAASAPGSATVTCSRIVREKPSQDENLEWISRRMTRSCKQYGWDLNHIVSYDRFTCNYVGQGTVLVDGKKQQVYNPFKQWSGTLATCSNLNETADLSIPDSTYKDAQAYAYYMADGDNANLEEDQFLCRIESLPRL